VLDVIREVRPSFGLELNVCKTELFWSSFDGSKLIDGLSLMVLRSRRWVFKFLGGGG